jgi:hypothetical protein
MPSLVPPCSPRTAFCAAALFIYCALTPRLPAAGITWIGNNNDWYDGADNNANWNPADEPDSDDTAIFNTPNSVPLTSNNTISGLTLSNAAVLIFSTRRLTVNGPVSLSGADTALSFNSATGALTAYSAILNSGTGIALDGCTLTFETPGTPAASLAVNFGALIRGNGTVLMNDALSVTTTLIDNKGTLSAYNLGTQLTPPPVATLRLDAFSVNARIDLDGSASPETGALEIQRNQTLDINLPPTDAFNGTLSLAQNTRLDIASAWTLGTDASVVVDNGASGLITAATSFIAGGTLTQTGGSINITDDDGTLQFDPIFHMNGGGCSARGHIIFNNTANITSAASFARIGPSKITVNGGRTLTINQSDFDLDANNTAAAAITVQIGASVIANLADYDPDSAINAFDGTINLNNGLFRANTGDPQFVLNGTLNMFANSASSSTVWEGEPLHAGDDSGTLDARIRVTGNRASRFANTVIFRSDADLQVANGATLIFDGPVQFHGVNGLNRASFTGTGELAFNNAVSFVEPATLFMPGGVIDLDGTDTSGDEISVHAPVTFNAKTLRTFGRPATDGSVQRITIDSLNSGRTGSLTVLLDDPAASWTINAPAFLELHADASTPEVLISGNELIMNGEGGAVGQCVIDARMIIGGTMHSFAAARVIFNGGTAAKPNRLEGGTLTGSGVFAASGAAGLRGQGVVDSNISFSGSTPFAAEHGVLSMNGSFIGGGGLLLAGEDGTLRVNNSWNTASVSLVQIQDGGLSGGTITNDNPNGISGYGRLSAPFINNTSIRAVGGYLSVETFAHNNDWDGAANNGTLAAENGAYLLLVDDQPFTFGGRISATGGTVSAGFGMTFTPASTLFFSGGGGFYCNGNCTIQGQVEAQSPGPAQDCSIQTTSMLVFASGSRATLDANLHLSGPNNVILSGAEFTGTHTLVIPPGSNLNLSTGALMNNNVLSIKGGLHPGGQGIGRVEVKSMGLESTATLRLHLAGTGSTQFDRIQASGTVSTGGLLSLVVEAGYTPAPNASFDIINATSVTGQFQGVQATGTPAGGSWELTYTPTTVRVTFRTISNYDAWIAQFTSLTNPADRLKSADPDKDGFTNLAEFALNGNPTRGTGAPLVSCKILTLSGSRRLTFTLPVRVGTVFQTSATGEYLLFSPDDSFSYRLQATTDLADFTTRTVIDATPEESTAAQAALPALDPGWTYRTFRPSALVSATPRQWMRALITE